MAKARKMNRSGGVAPTKRGKRQVWEGHTGTKEGMVKKQLTKNRLENIVLCEDGNGFYLTREADVRGNLLDGNRMHRRWDLIKELSSNEKEEMIVEMLESVDPIINVTKVPLVERMKEKEAEVHNLLTIPFKETEDEIDVLPDIEKASIRVKLYTVSAETVVVDWVLTVSAKKDEEAEDGGER